MTTWTNAKITRKIKNFVGGLQELIVTIDGVSGDTGGTLTVKSMKRIEFASVQVEVDTGPAGYATGLLYYISANTVVVAYTNPVDGHTVRIRVLGK